MNKKKPTTFQNPYRCQLRGPSTGSWDTLASKWWMIVMDYDSSKNKNLWAHIYCSVFHVIYLHWHKGEVKLLHQLTNVEGVLEPECHKGVLKLVRGSWMRGSWSPGTPVIEVVLTEAKQEQQGEACRSLAKCDDVWASVSGPASIPASWSNGQGFCGIPHKTPQPDSTRENVRQTKTEGHNFCLQKHWPACFTDVEVRKTPSGRGAALSQRQDAVVSAAQSQAMSCIREKSPQRPLLGQFVKLEYCLCI